MTRGICVVCGKDTHISEAFQLQIGKHEEAWICVWCIDKQLKTGSDYRVVKTIKEDKPWIPKK